MSYLYATCAAYFKSTFAVLHFLLTSQKKKKKKEDILHLLMAEIIAERTKKSSLKRFNYVLLYCAFHSHQFKGRVELFLIWTGKQAGSPAA